MSRARRQHQDEAVDPRDVAKPGRMTGAEFDRALRDIGWSLDKWCEVVGPRKDRAIDWRQGREDIPAWVPIICAALTEPAARALAEATAQHYRQQEEQSDAMV